MTHIVSCFDLYLTPLDFLLSIQASLRFSLFWFFPKSMVVTLCSEARGQSDDAEPKVPQLGTVTTAAGGICPQPSGLCREKTAGLTRAQRQADGFDTSQ